MKSRTLFLVLSYMFLLSDVSATFHRIEGESELLRTLGYDADFKDIRCSIVRNYSHELRHKLSPSLESRRLELVGYLERILDNVCYPVGLQTLADSTSGDWNAIVAVIDKDHRNWKSEFKRFYKAIKSILESQDRHIRLDLSCLSKKKATQMIDDETSQSLLDIATETSQSSLSSNDDDRPVQRDGLVSVSSLEIYEDLENEDVPEKFAQKLLANVLIKRLVVCLPTYAEVRFWSLKSIRSSSLPTNFRNFERVLDKSLLEMRYNIRNGNIGRNSWELEQWVLDNFIKVYERLPESRDIKRDPSNLLENSVSRIGLTNSLITNVLKELGAIILGSQKIYATYRERKPFIVTYGVSSSLIQRYLTLGLGWIVHEVSAYDLQDHENNRNIVLGKSYSWRDVENVEDISHIVVNKGWLLDTFMEDGGGRGTFLDNILLIKDSERLLDSECVCVHGDIGETLSRFIIDLVSTDCTSIEVPYLGSRISTEHLITIMVCEKENVEAGRDTINIKDLRPSLELRCPKPNSTFTNTIDNEDPIRGSDEDDQQFRNSSESPTTALIENISEEPDDEAISFDECRQTMRDLLREQNKSLDNSYFEYCSGILEGLLSGTSFIGSGDFDCAEAIPFYEKKKNFLEKRSPESLALVRAMISGFVRNL